MKSKEMARSYIEDAKIILDEAKIAFNKKIFHRVVRLCQEATELALKACLRIIAIEYPKNHDVSDVLIENKDKFPEWFKEKIEYLSEASSWLSEKRGVAMYGDEIGGIPALRLFDENDGKKALEYASEIIKLSIKFFEEFYST